MLLSSRELRFSRLALTSKKLTQIELNYYFDIKFFEIVQIAWKLLLPLEVVIFVSFISLQFND